MGKEKPLRVSGGLSFNQVMYGVSGIKSRRSLIQVAAGKVNPALYGCGFSLSNQNISYRQPINQFNLHPTCKSITAHIGYVGLSVVVALYRQCSHLSWWRCGGSHSGKMENLAACSDAS